MLTGSKFYSVIFLVISILGICYVFFRSEIVLNASYEAYLKYYILFTASSLFWAFVLTLDDSLRKNILLVAASSIFAIYLIETIISFNKDLFGIKFQDLDFRTKFEVHNDLLKEGIDSTIAIMNHKPFMTETGNKVQSIAGVSNKTTVFCNESGEYSIYESDRYGFNNPDEEWQKSGVTFLVGDSFTHGACVPQSEDISSYLRLILDQPVLNLGFFGSGPLRQLASVIEYTHVDDLNAIVWVYFEGNDLSELGIEKKEPELSKYLTEDYIQGLVNLQNEIDINQTEYIKNLMETAKFRKSINQSEKNTLSKILFLKHTRKLINLDKSTFKITNDKYKINKDDLILFESILKRVSNISSSKDAKFYFVYLPDFKRYHYEKGDSYQHKGEIMKIVKKLNIPIIDIDKQLFSKARNPKKFFMHSINNHYTSSTYKMIAKEIAQLLN